MFQACHHDIEPAVLIICTVNAMSVFYSNICQKNDRKDLLVEQIRGSDAPCYLLFNNVEK
jgi:hypothetical protein